jgi:NADPH:quinone reductase-like Zn-dependent oxidoreductase
VPGFEGSGTVVISGGDAYGQNLLNKRVAFFTDGQIGSYSEYTIVKASICVPLPENLDFDAAQFS